MGKIYNIAMRALSRAMEGELINYERPEFTGNIGIIKLLPKSQFTTTMYVDRLLEGYEEANQITKNDLDSGYKGEYYNAGY